MTSNPSYTQFEQPTLAGSFGLPDPRQPGNGQEPALDLDVRSDEAVRLAWDVVPPGWDGHSKKTAGLWPFFCLYGGKWRVAPHYETPAYPSIVEPFAGSAGYSLRYPHLDIHLNDRDPIIAGLWRYLIGVSEQEILGLPLEVEHVDSLPISQEAKWLIGFWLNKGMTAPCKTPSKWMRDGWRPNSQWGGVIRARIASQLGAIRHWRITEGSWSELETPEATWFVDPPYNNRVGRRYRYHVFNYSALGTWCRSLPGQVIVCEQQGATWLPFRTFRAIKSTEGRLRENRSAEVLWTNGPPYWRTVVAMGGHRAEIEARQK
jgi:hypothetical protein